MIKRRVECNKYSGSLPVHQIFLCQAVFGLVIYRAPRIPRIDIHWFHSKIFFIFRSAGDVLQDIGSMLSDLTDELDAMLKLEKDTD